MLKVGMKETFINRGKSWMNKILPDGSYCSNDSYYYLVLLTAPVLLAIYRYFTEAQNFLAYFPELNRTIQGEIYAYLLEYLAFFVLMLVIPFLLSVFYKKSKLLTSLLGFRVLKMNLLWTLLALCVLVIPGAFHASTLQSVLVEYPLPRTLLQNQQLLPVYFLGLFFLYYLPWEFFFRGFLLFSLKEKYGTVPAILIQTISSSLVHIGKPTPEIIGSIPFGIIFGIIAIRTKNLWIVVLLHAALGIFTDLFIIY